MNVYLDKFLNTRHDREPIFRSILHLFGGKPIKITETGCTRNKIDLNGIYGDGYSTFFWVEYIKKHGGSLKIIDTDLEALKCCQEMLGDFADGIDIRYVQNYGHKEIEGDEDLVYLDSGDSPDFMYEEYLKADRRKTLILCDDFASKGVRLIEDYPDYVPLRCAGGHLMAVYYPVDYGDKSFKINDLELEYVRETPNRAYRNERSVELGLAKWFATKYNNEIIELGAVCPQYSFFDEWPVIDPYDETYKKALRLDIADADYENHKVLSISTVEHCGLDVGDNQPVIKDLAARGVQKIIDESGAYLITFPIGANIYLEEYIKNSNLNYFFMTRENVRGEKNNWVYSKDKKCWDHNYLHFNFKLGYYGSAHSICVLTSEKELL